MPKTLSGMDSSHPRRTRPGILRLLAALMLLTVGFVGPGTATAQTPAPEGHDTAALAASLAHMIGVARAGEGLQPLGWDPGLADIALGWTRSMAADGRLSHNPDASASHEAEWTRFGENVGQAKVPGAEPAEVISRLHAAFMASSGHRANVLQPVHRAIGVGVVVADDGRVWVTVNFADSAPPEAPAQARRGHYQRPAR